MSLTRNFLVGAVGGGAVVVGIALMLSSYKPIPAATQTEEPSFYWEKIAPMPKNDGVYVMHDQENGNVCYLVLATGGANGTSPAVAYDCQYEGDKYIQP